MVFWDVTACNLVDSDIAEEPVCSISRIGGGCRFQQMTMRYIPEKCNHHAYLFYVAFYLSYEGC
jgi:hypothetical protein